MYDQGKATFLEDAKTQDAVLRNLQVLAESTQQGSAAANPIDAQYVSVRPTSTRRAG